MATIVVELDLFRRRALRFDIPCPMKATEVIQSAGCYMMKNASLAGMMLAITWAPPCSAQGSPVDWKFYGDALVEKAYIECFYDEKGVAREADHNTRVWVKCLLRTDLDGVDIKRDFKGKILENTAQKAAPITMSLR